MPLLFAVYLAAVPAYAARPALLFGFLFLVDAGLLAIALARRQGLLHAVGAVATMLVDGDLDGGLVRSDPGAGLVAVGFTALFSVFYLVAPVVAGRFARPFAGPAARGALCRAAAPGRVPCARGDRARVCGTVAAHGRAAGARRADRLASRGEWQRVAVLHRGVLRHRHAGGVVGDAPDARTAGHGRGHLRRVRPRVARRSGRRAPDVASAPAGVGWRRGPAPRARPPVLSLARAGGAGRALGAGAAPRHHQCRALHRERRRTPADSSRRWAASSRGS